MSFNGKYVTLSVTLEVFLILLEMLNLLVITNTIVFMLF